jgi:hypothetical protein
MLLGQESGFQKERVALSVPEAAAALRWHRRDPGNNWRFARPGESPPIPAQPWDQP